MTQAIRTAGTTLDTVIIFTDRMEELSAFYAEGLGIGPLEKAPGHIGGRVGSIYLGFDQVEEMRGRTGGGATLWFTVDDVDTIFARLTALGAAVRYAPTLKPWAGYLAAVYDPDGNMIGLSQRTTA